MPIINNGYFNDPALAQGFSNLAGLFKPPSGTDLAGYAAANERKQAADRLSWLFNNSGDPTASARAALTGVQGYGETPTGFTYKVDQDSATSRANNANTVKGGLLGQLYGPLNQGQVRPELPADVAGTVGLPTLGAVQGAPKPLSETEAKAQVFQGLPTTDQRSAVLSEIPVESVIMGNGQPQVVRRADAVGNAPYSATAARPTTQNYRDPTGHMGTAFAGPDGKLMDTQTGQPIPAGSVEIKVNVQGSNPEQAMGNATRQDAKNNVVTEDIGRALAVIQQHPRLATGLPGQVLSGVGGTSANTLSTLLDGIRANIGFDQLSAMRAASPTGGALGAISDNEEKLLQSVLGSTATSQNPDDLAYNLKRLNNIVLDTVHGKGNGPARFDLAGDAPQMVTPGGSGGAPDMPTVASPEEALKLPPGTHFRTPDGRVKVR